MTSDVQSTKSDMGVNHVFCVLHMKQRIHERLLSYIAGTFNDNDFATFTNNIRNLNGCGDFHWWTKSDVPNFDTTDLDDERSLSQTTQIRGYQVEIMLNNISEMFTNIDSKRVPEFKLLLSLWRKLVCHIQVTSEDLNKHKEAFYDSLNLKVFKDLLKLIFPKKTIRSQYIHILYHLEYYFKTFGCLVRYSNQGLENSHKYHKALVTRISNNGGGPKSKHQTIETILLWQCRKIIACIDWYWF